ncbi:MAG TPA: ribosome small subunit-dependent GTPase A [Bacilli bacterium]|nr:ribosome small subunit-dependent GTPase A [Bacilli bacterium]
MIGRIIKQISNDYTVLGNDNNLYVCKARGKFRNIKVTPIVGDLVNFDIDKKYIMKILPRENMLIRPTVANIDQLIIISSVKEPDFDSNLLDKLLVIAEYNRLKPIICLSKVDLLNEKELENINYYADYYKKIGYEVIINHEVDDIKNRLKNKITVFTGQSGAGKSTLLNHLDNNLDIKTGEISYALGRGKHTTRHTELLNVNDGWVADTPGFSSLDFIDMTKEEIRDNFVEFQELRDECKYKDCMHIKENDCAIKDNVENGNILKERYDNYIKFINSKEKEH